MSEPLEGELLPLVREDAPSTERKLTLNPMSCVLIFDPHRMSVIAPPLGDDPDGDVPPHVALALTTADMLQDAAFIKLMFELWEKKTGGLDDTRGEGQTTH